ncbi:MAG: DUF21 domain-containing protein [Candidatus Dadabacteria bacterium]|nr:DUF21 domain-containing protein [Candidatus Dadabacteria bacterium]NIS08463.1 DUF21 domain-containing protein [Candidatus Dadabacteria bacterium]NIY21951.1 DUF21 domain-containing protein [Candidatus Dadabacteria bacterium]
MTLFIWIGILACIMQAGILSGLNLACFSISKLRLEIESSKSNKKAIKVLKLREDSNFLLSTILWANVAVNVLLTLLSKSILAGVTAFIFSTLLITFFGEIIPQAYFSRHALKIASALSPMLRLYQILLYPVAKPTALILDRILGPEAIQYFQERDLEEIIKMHIESAGTEIDELEGIGALNFLAIDDLPITDEGEFVDPKSIIALDFEDSRAMFPNVSKSVNDNFLKQVLSSGKKWIMITDKRLEPRLVLNSNSFLRAVLSDPETINPYAFCHKPIVVKNPDTRLGDIINQIQVYTGSLSKNILDERVVLYWNDRKRIITASDILDRLLAGIKKQKSFNNKEVKTR